MSIEWWLEMMIRERNSLSQVVEMFLRTFFRTLICSFDTSSDDQSKIIKSKLAKRARWALIAEMKMNRFHENESISLIFFIETFLWNSNSLTISLISLNRYKWKYWCNHYCSFTNEHNLIVFVIVSNYIFMSIIGSKFREIILIPYVGKYFRMLAYFHKKLFGRNARKLEYLLMGKMPNIIWMV